METTGLFNKENTDVKFSQLCGITKDRIESFLPGLWTDLFKVNNNAKKSALPSVETVSVSAETGPVTDATNLPVEKGANEEASNAQKELGNLTVTTVSDEFEKGPESAPISPVKVAPVAQEVQEL